ncbi:hypothetical protein [Pseudotenacibaculum haliotis]|uniref:Uncharacterized protein n=1 Tax=Pseudotenacibaculum haliotis TaxID=1862138 RepID=A0ABW5LUV6_9FLAO
MSTNIPAEKAALVLTKLKDQANELLSAAHNVQLDMYHAQGSGNFPYYYKDPATRRFNEKTYVWLNQCLEKRKNGEPVSFEGDYNGKFLRAVTNVSYTLSRKDQARLNEVKRNALNQQGALLDAWEEAFGEIPSGKAPINGVFEIILKDWVTKEGTTLQDLLVAPDLFEALGKAPAAAMPVIPVVGNYLNAIEAGIPLQNAISLNNGILKSVRSSINFPSEANGGVQLNDGTDDFFPEYPFSTTQAKILDGLKSDNSVDIQMKLSNFNSSDVSLSVSGEASFKMPLGFFDIDLGASANYFTNIVTKNSRTIEIDMKFTGVTVAKFGPEPFRVSGRKGWHFADGIKESIANGEKDISGFKFSPKPNIDFTEGGDFGVVNAVAFSQYPTMKIKVFSSDYKKIKTDFDAAANAGLKIDFLGMPLGVGLKGSYKQGDVSINEAEGSITINVNPPIEAVAEKAVEATAFILGVQTEYSAIE